MPHHIVTLNYSPNGFKAVPDDLGVHAGDTMSFELGIAPPDSTFKITMDTPKGFSPTEASDSTTKITVVKALTSTYTCELFDASGKKITQAGQAGGSVRPA